MTPRRLLLAVLALAAPLAATAPAAAQSPAQDGVYGRQTSGLCRPPLKFAAGACVRRCPAGYQDMGRRCRLRNQVR